MIRISHHSLSMVQELKDKGWKVDDITGSGDILMTLQTPKCSWNQVHKVWVDHDGFIAGPWWTGLGEEVNHGRYASYGYPGVPCDRLKRKGVPECLTFSEQPLTK